jgi:phospholipid/cholesterol/gamma-HCH transport system substrate-binding protein
MSLGTQRLAGIGLIVGIALAVLLGVTKPNPLAKTYTYWAVFDTAHGLGAIDRDVRIAGVKVGEVGAVERQGDDVRVELKLKEDHPLRTDARADMRPHTLFEGSNFIDLAPGSPGAPKLEDGGTIPIRQTTNYVTLDRALRILRPEIRDDLQKLAEVGARTLRGDAITGVQTMLKRAPALSVALAPAARAAQGPNRREFVRSINGLSRTVDALAAEREDLIPLAQRVNRTMGALAVDGGAPLDAALDELPATLQALNDGAPSLDTTLRRLATFSSKLGTSAPRSVARALRATTPVLTKAAPVLHDGTPVVRGARLIASRLAAAKAGLVTMFDTLAEPLKLFPEMFATLNEKTSLGASSGALQLVGGAFQGLGGALATYQTKAQNPNQPGHQLRANLQFDPAAAGGLLNLLGGGGSGALPLLRSTAAPAVSCAVIRQVSPRAVRTAKANGGCR